MSRFQIILVAVFGVFILAGVFIFAFARPSGGAQVNVLVWGSIPDSDFNSVLLTLPLVKDKTVSIQYVYKREADFDKDFVEALASGVGPDVVMLGQDSIVTHRRKLFIVPFASYSERTFKDTYIQEGELFLEPTGVLGFPVLVDPLVMYWNRDIFTANSVAQPPAYWDQLFDLSKTFTQKDGALNISRATAALGEFQNITNAKEIVSTLMMQAGSPLVQRTLDGGFESVFAQSFGRPVAPAVSAVNFYTEFSNPLKSDYTWNRSLPESQLMFTSGDLALYFGFASEFQTLKQKNPNLNFDVALIPQARTTDSKVTFGKMKAFAITKNSKNPASAFTVIAGLSSSNAISAFAKLSGLPPVRRDLIGAGTTNANDVLFYKSALWARGWLDPSRVSTNSIMRSMIESITGGRARSAEAVDTADQNITSLLQTN